VKRVVLASANAGKLRELGALLAPLAFEIVPQSVLGIGSPPETGTTFLANALLKARHAAAHAGLPALADDSGLEVDSLGGRPGVRSARYAYEGASDTENLERLLAELSTVPDERRGARYQCVIVLTRSAQDDAPLIARGTWEGHIARGPRGQGGFGYDPVFVPAGGSRTAAELTAVEKNAVSHRGRALAALIARLEAGGYIALSRQPDAPMKRGRLIVISAPSGAGKTSLVKKLLEDDPCLELSTSHTTRKRRPTEAEGREYHFVTVERFKSLEASGEFLESARVFDNFYGTSRSFVDERLAAGRDVVLEIDWQGARQVRARMPHCISIFVLPPSRAALAERLARRATDSAEVIARRLADAAGDMSHYREFDYVVVNEDFAHAVADLKRIIAGEGEALRSDRPELAALLAQLLHAGSPNGAAH
jgi:guanylate kinase/non-canonical purine NTP pyrophosphatase (RdgB/HAM1 family)